jgi:hypothetical protein
MHRVRRTHQISVGVCPKSGAFKNAPYARSTLLEEFDDLEAEDIRAALGFVAESMDHKILKAV